MSLYSCHLVHVVVYPERWRQDVYPRRRLRPLATGTRLVNFFAPPPPFFLLNPGSHRRAHARRSMRTTALRRAGGRDERRQGGDIPRQNGPMMRLGYTTTQPFIGKPRHDCAPIMLDIHFARRLLCFVAIPAPPRWRRGGVEGAERASASAAIVLG